MRIILFLLLLFPITNWGQSNDIEGIPFNAQAFEWGETLSNSKKIDVVIKEVNEKTNNDTVKLFLIAGWIYQNISFDLENFSKGSSIPGYQLVLDNKRALCGGFTSLFAEFCKRLNLKNEVVEGYVQELDEHKTSFLETNHVWNIVKLGDNWFHCDLLWMSGILKLNTNNVYSFEKKLDEQMFLTQSKKFYKSHIPADPMWQLSKSPLSFEEMINGKDFDDNEGSFDYINAINKYSKLSHSAKLLLFADNAYNFNNNNTSVIVINNLNEAVNLLNTQSKDKKAVQTAGTYLKKAKKYLQQGVYKNKQIENQINEMLKAINQ